MDLFSLQGVFMAVASCAVVHVGFAAFGLEYIFHDLGEGIRSAFGMDPLHSDHNSLDFHGH